jgi:hypothetical protein
MSTYTSEPGTRLAGRYRLVDQISAGTGWTYWKATDETLARSVTVLTFAPGFPRVTEAVTAARTASRLNDTRFAQVFDVEDGGDIAYAVLEWVRGESLLDLLSEGPLEPRRAVSLAREAAQALAVAHRAGLAHLRLDASRLHWTSGGGVKITGLGIDAALAGPELVDTEDPAATDTCDLARLLYAALTGYWPGPADGVLPPAPTDSEGEPCSPRQVAAGVPAGIDSVTCRALFQHENRQGPALTTPEDFADALAQVAPPALAPPSAGPPPVYERDYSTRVAPYARGGSTAELQRGTGTAGYRRRHPETERSAVARAVVSVVIVLVLVAIGVTAWAISRSLQHGGTPPTARQTASSGTSAAAAALLKPVSASVYSLPGTTADNPGAASDVLNPSSGQYWHTQYYLGYPQFGRLKSGVGLILDMGSAVRLSQLNVRFGTSCCAHVNIEVGSDLSGPLSSFTQVATSTTAAGPTTFNITSQATGRYVLIWIDYLPPLAGQSGYYEAQVYSVTARGSSA